MSVVVEIWSDIRCPWATLAVLRLRRARDELGLDVVLEPRAWPLEWVNDQGADRGELEGEMAVLSQHEPEAFGRYTGATWPSTFLPALELVAAARRHLGSEAAEEVDHRLRLAFFRDGRDISLRAALRDIAEETFAGKAGEVMAVWESEPARADIAADFARAGDLGIEGSPTVVWPDGTTTHNPGVGEIEHIRGLPHPRDVDPQAHARLLRRHIA